MNTNYIEIKLFIDILMIMGVVNFPSYVDCWGQYYTFLKIPDFMSLQGRNYKADYSKSVLHNI